MSDDLANAREPHPVRAYRDKHDLTLSQVARAAGLSPGGLSRIESCESMPSPRVFQRLSQACGYEVSEIDIFRYHLASSTGAVPRLHAPTTKSYQWHWVAAGREQPTPAAA